MSQVMTHDLICTWLGLRPGEWPPDHYRLLGIEPGENDPARIEKQVHERLERVRRYQLLHPELVTEAMNRLAQAYVCLTDPQSRRAYDAARSGRPLPPEPLFPEPPAEPAAAPAAAPAAPPAAEPSGEVVVDATLEPPPVRIEPAPVEPPPVRIGTAPTEPLVESATPTESQPARLEARPEPEPVRPEAVPYRRDPVVEAERAATWARRGLGTRQAVYTRLADTRRLIRLWDRVGDYVAEPSRRLTRPAEAVELIGRLQALRQALADFPPLLGEAGQPGYAVVSLARQPAPVPVFQTLLPSQRTTLAQHWRSGRHLLEVHRGFLCAELQVLRRKSLWQRSVRAVRAAVNDRPTLTVALVLLVLALIALAQAYLF